MALSSLLDKSSDSNPELKLPHLLLGNIGKSHGLKGHFFVWPAYDVFDEFQVTENQSLFVNQKSFWLESFSRNLDRFLIKLTGVDHPESVKALAGQEIYFAPEKLPEKGFYIEQLKDWKIQTQLGTAKLIDIEKSPAHFILKLELPGDREFLVPWVPEFINELKPDQSHLSLDLNPFL